MLSAWAHHHRTKRNNSLALLPSLRNAGAFKSSLLTTLSGAGTPTSRDPRLLAPLVMFTETELSTERIDDAIETLRIAHQPTEDVLQHCLEDLCRNVFHHARTDGGGAHLSVGISPNQKFVRLGIADCGQGIARDIQNTHGAQLSDVRAVQLALEPKVSGSATPSYNMGVGLYLVRRMVLAARGAMRIHTGNVLVEISSSSVAQRTPQAREVGTFWQGTAISATFSTHTIDDFQDAISRIRDEIEGRGPRYQEVLFTASIDDDSTATISLQAEVEEVALDRVLARTIAVEQIAPALARGGPINVDFSAVRMTSQAFCYALLWEAFQQHGPSLLPRMRFIACSSQVRPMVRMAIFAGLEDWKDRKAG